MAIWLDVEPRSGVPIYVQIVQQIKHAIEVSALQPGEQLPTVRQLAVELTIAPNTIVKAYNELQSMGLVESRAGVGTVVAPNLNGSVQAQRMEAFTTRLRALVRDAATLGIEPADLAALVQAEIDSYYSHRRNENDSS
ncbi:MAG: GntR family transcriptional regulator [Chloroflexia bacterium]